MPALSPAAADLAAANHGRLSRAELSAQGLTRHQIDTLVRTGVLTVEWTAEYRVVGAPTTRRQQLLGATRRVDGHAADASAFGLRRAEGFPLLSPFVVTVPARSRIRAVRPVQREHDSEVAKALSLELIRTDLDDIDTDVVDAIPTMTAERAAIGLAASTRPARLRVALHDLRRRNLLGFALLHRRAQALKYVPGAAEMQTLLDSDALMAESPPEHDLGSIWLPDDPTPRPQV